MEEIIHVGPRVQRLYVHSESRADIIEQATRRVEEWIHQEAPKIVATMPREFSPTDIAHAIADHVGRRFLMPRRPEVKP